MKRSTRLLLLISLFWLGCASNRRPAELRLVVLNELDHEERIVIRLDDRTLYAGIVAPARTEPALTFEVRTLIHAAQHSIDVTAPAQSTKQMFRAHGITTVEVTLRAAGPAIAVKYGDFVYI